MTNKYMNKLFKITRKEQYQCWLKYNRLRMNGLNYNEAIRELRYSTSNETINYFIALAMEVINSKIIIGSNDGRNDNNTKSSNL